MINGLSVGGGQQVAQVTPTGAAIKLHFAYNNNSNNSSSSNISNSNYSGLKTSETKMRNNKNYTGRALKIVEKIPGASGVIATTSGNQGARSLEGYSPAAASYVSGLSRDFLISRELSQRSGEFLTAAAKMVSQMGASELRWLPISRTKDKPSSAGEAEAKTLVREGESQGSPGKVAKSALGDPQPQRTEDQENAFRRIEDVHNYAKLQDCSSDTDDEDDEEEDLDEEEDDEEEAEIQVQLPVQQEVTRIRREAAEEHVDVDVVTVPQQEQDQYSHQVEPRQLQQDETADNTRPEHHARRPMNAFLIFCKRHRGIVKERYKTLENRAITKILGDWWAALDEQEKHCFTDLAQQNKDAFFNANPNFKWYKLPAPPLRTLATRPSNASAGLLIPSEDQPQQQVPTSLQVQWAERGEMPRAMLRPNYFKLADETQMGELSSLLQVQVQEKDFALQQVLSETSQFLSAHMPAGNTNGNGNKRSLQDNNSSNSSEEEAASGSSPNKKVKSSRSCKGKIYQELVNSGQLAAIAKKSKARLPPAGNMGGNFVDIPLDAGPNTPPVSPPERQGSSPDSMQKHIRSVSESSSSGFFDLEEKIKELPALSLDAYLQRKRSTKKKKKFSGTKKQRNSNSTSGASATSNVAAADAAAKGAVPLSSEQHVRIKQQQLQAVGSQRRKARKESITRRDVSAIEQEVASILPLTINGSYYFNQSGAPKAVNAPVTSSSASPPLSSNSSSSSSSLSSQAAFDVTSSTSDLLILAEVAANRTELTKSN
uniref:Bobby sox n=1 Tax=Drosophila melanogaster TaxID=7227 RepID=O61348_DROME|eukprot:NP_001027087.1 bobby sox, isoform C [Drosophila melanogaster]